MQIIANLVTPMATDGQKVEIDHPRAFEHIASLYSVSEGQGGKPNSTGSMARAIDYIGSGKEYDLQETAKRFVNPRAMVSALVDAIIASSPRTHDVVLIPRLLMIDYVGHSISTSTMTSPLFLQVLHMPTQNVERKNKTTPRPGQHFSLPWDLCRNC